MLTMVFFQDQNTSIVIHLLWIDDYNKRR